VRPDLRLSRACVIAVLAFAGCGGSEVPSGGPAPGPDEAPTEAPTSDAPTTVETPPPAATDGSSPAINSITVDPGDGTILIGTGPSLFRLAAGAKDAERIIGKLTAPQGEGTVSGNLVVRFAGPGDLLASGHPQAGDLIVAVNAESPDIQVSRDGGRSWESRTPPAAPIDVVVDPGDAEHWAVSTEQGTFFSGDGGGSWRPRDTTFGARLVWPAKDALFSVDRNGGVRVSPDGGRSWDERGEVGGLPSEVTAGRQKELFAAVVGGKIRRSRDGGRTWSTLTTLR
jgi:hypothetical protein